MLNLRSIAADIGPETPRKLFTNSQAEQRTESGSSWIVKSSNPYGIANQALGLVELRVEIRGLIVSLLLVPGYC
jgi:hypothetical protein